MSTSTSLSAGEGTTRASTSRSRLRTNPISLLLGAIVLLAGVGAGVRMNTQLPIAVGAVAFILIVLGLQMAYAWEAAVVLRAGRFRKLAGPGLFAIVPIVDNVAMWIDQRMHTSATSRSPTLCKTQCRARRKPSGKVKHG